MKKLIPFLVVVATIFFTNNTVNAQTYKVNNKETKVVWHAEKVTGSHTGNVTVKEGQLMMENGKLTGGNFVIDMTSITCTDLEGEYNQKLVGHLKSDDFFGVANFPTATLKIKQAVHQGKNDYKIIGDLTIKGITKPIKFNATINEESGKITGKGKLIIDRAEYNVRYGSGSFFDDLGDKTIYDEFELNITLIANK